MLTNEKGIVLPLVLVVSLVTASLLMTLSSRLESQARSYEQRRAFQEVTLLEKEAVQLISELLSDSNFISTLPSYESTGSIPMTDGTIITLNYYNGTVSLRVTYHFLYSEYPQRGMITYNKREQSYVLH